MFKGDCWPGKQIDAIHQTQPIHFYSTRFLLLMFTGLIESTARITSFEPRSGGAKLSLQVGALAGEVALGDSVAVNGCCLTATEIDVTTGTLAFDLLEQTMRVTSLGDLVVGSVVNIERAMRWRPLWWAFRARSRRRHGGNPDLAARWHGPSTRGLAASGSSWIGHS
jgi:Lumazine binding domain